MPTINFSELIGGSLATLLNDQSDWAEWRLCYEAGNEFRDQELKRFSDRETKKEFIRRTELTPIPSYARLEINRVKNAISQRLPDIIRRGGTKKWHEAIDGIGRGIDQRGSSLNSFISKYLLSEALVMRRVGVLVDAPRVAGNTAADVPQGFRPYLNYFPVEHIERVIPADPDSPSDFKAVILREVTQEYDPDTVQVTDKETFRYFWIDPERGNKVTIQKLDNVGTEIDAPVETNLDAIPFVIFDIGQSLIKDVCSYQIAHLNLISADTSYAIDANYPIMVRQRGNSIPAHLLGEEDQADVGNQKGLWYDRGLDAPAWISPDTAPINTGLSLRKGFREEVHELVTGSLTNLGKDGTIEAGLAFIGECFEHGESRLWDHWVSYELAREEERKNATPQIVYPEDWSLKTDEERIEEANKYVDLMNKLPGQKGKREAAKVAYERLFRGRLPTEELDGIKREVDTVPYTTSDASIIIKAKEKGIVSAETAALALGFNAEEAEKAKKDQADRQAAQVAAQMDAAGGAAGGAGRGNPDGSVDPDSPSLAREGEVAGSQSQGRPGIRGEGEETNEDE